MKKLFLFVTTLFILYSASAQQMLQSTDSIAMQQWVDSVMASLTPDQRLGQLIMPQIVGGNTPEVKARINQMLSKYHVGGFLFSKGTIASQAQLTRYAQQQSVEHPAFSGGCPLLISIDGEWGLAMRLSDAPKFPRNKVLGELPVSVRDSICYEYGREVARECQLLGIHINFAPVLDINSNPNNPVIGTRSFGASAEDVIAPAIAYAQGLEDGGVLSVGKHFPGHGDTDTDSHKTLPHLSHSREQMYQRELLPFKAYAEAGLGGIMVAHLDVPALAETSGIPSTASRKIVNDILREEFHFNGLIITDGLAMKGASNYPDINVKALLAGNDILLQPTPTDAAWNQLLAARKRGDLPQEIIDAKCRRVLQWKYVLTRNKPSKLTPEKLAAEINNGAAKCLIEQINQYSKKNTPSKPEIDATLEGDKLAADVASTSNSGKSNNTFAKVDSIIYDAIAKEAFPGCQILVAQKGQILYNKAFGWTDHSHKEVVTKNTKYDLASCTKALGTVPALMKTIDIYNIKLSDKLSKYIPEMVGTDKASLTIQQALFHETGMRDSYPFYSQTIDTASYYQNYYSGKKSDYYCIQMDKNTWTPDNLAFDTTYITSQRDARHSVPLAENLFITPSFRDTILQQTIGLPLHRTGRYRYSDLNFVFLRAVIERVSGMKLDQFLYTQLPQFYGKTLTYTPLQRGFDVNLIAPTEDDQSFRHQLLQGHVHDELCAWSGGIEGNAGLFGSAEEIFPIAQMLLDGGKWQEAQFIKESTVRTFTTRKSLTSRRGLGFDKPETVKGKANPCADVCSPATFGHTGFTGTCFWVDPKKDLVFIFLCNRINPHRWNRKLTSENIRPSLQKAVYEVIK